MLDGWVRSFVESGGLLGIGFLMALENVVPPIPSELVMPLAGYVAGSGEMTLVGVIAAGVIGTVAGAIALYGVGAWLGGERLDRFVEHHGHWLLLRPAELHRAERWFHRHGTLAVLIGRVVPGVRSLVSIPAGVCGMPMGRFVLLTTLGSSVWVALLGTLGYWLGERWGAVGDWVGPLALAVVGGLLVLHVGSAWRRRRSALSRHP